MRCVNMLDYVISHTNTYIESMPKSQRKKYGQFFTSKETAIFMAEMLTLPSIPQITILDPGAGSGILSVALIQRIMKETNITSVSLYCYENNPDVLPLLKSNLQYVKNNATMTLDYKIIEENYITSQSDNFNSTLYAQSLPIDFDLVIGNPPYMKIPKDAPEAVTMPSVCYGAPNLYFLFAAMSLYNLKRNGEMVYIIPRSWTSGAYFKKFREYFLTVGKLQRIHLFVSRDKVFDNEEVLQETIIVKVKKSAKAPEHVEITTSNSNKDFTKTSSLTTPYNLVVSDKELYVYLLTSKSELEVLKRMHTFRNTLPSLGLKMKTGLTVDFRSWDWIRQGQEENTVPLFYSQHIKDGRIIFPIEKEKQYITTEQKGLIQKNKNYLFVKRFTAKEEKRRLQCGIYLSSDFPEYEYISTQNKLNFIDGINIDLSEDIVYGLYVLFNSTLFDAYYRILNGSTQVNSTEINNMPVPSLDAIKKCGKLLKLDNCLSESKCDEILEAVLNE